MIIKNVFITGASGSGKSTIVKYILSKYENAFLSISYTTRLPRSNEKHGLDYFFVSKQYFEDKIKENYFLEYVEFKGNYYGTPIIDSAINKITQKHSTVIRIFDIETIGVNFFHTGLSNGSLNLGTISDNHFICIHTEKDNLHKRLLQRKNITSIEIENRLKSFDDVTRFKEIFNFDHIIDTNGSIDKTYLQVIEIFNNIINK